MRIRDFVISCGKNSYDVEVTRTTKPRSKYNTMKRTKSTNNIPR